MHLDGIVDELYYCNSCLSGLPVSRVSEFELPRVPMPSDRAEVMVGQWTLQTYSYILRQAWDDAPRPMQAYNSSPGAL